MTQEKSSFLLRFAEAALPLLTLFLLFPLVMGMMQDGAPPAPKAKEVEERSWLVSTERAKFGDAAPSIALYGKVVVPDAVRLSASIAAEVTSLYVREGQQVEKGQKLLSFDSLDAEAVAAQRRAELQDIAARIDLQITQHGANEKSLAQERRLLSLSRTELKRTQNLRRRNAIPQATVDSAKQAEVRQSLAVTQRQAQVDQHDSIMAQLQANKARAEVTMRVAQRDLDSTEVVAPVAGKVVKINVRQGDRVAPGMVAMDLFDPSSAEIKAQIPLKHLPLLTKALAEGVPLRATANVDGQVLQAVMDRFAGEATRGGGVEAFFRLEGGKTVVQVGRGFKLALTLPAEKDVLALPFSAVYGLDRAYTMVDGRLNRIEVERVGELPASAALGREKARILVRSSGLKGGERIVISQLANAVQGLKIRQARPKGGSVVSQVYIGLRPEFYDNRGDGAEIESTVTRDESKRTTRAELVGGLEELIQKLDVTSAQVVSTPNRVGVWVMYPSAQYDERKHEMLERVTQYAEQLHGNTSLPVSAESYEVVADSDYVAQRSDLVRTEMEHWLRQQNLPESDWQRINKLTVTVMAAASPEELEKVAARLTKHFGDAVLKHVDSKSRRITMWLSVSTTDVAKQKDFADKLAGAKKKIRNVAITTAHEYVHKDDLGSIEKLQSQWNEQTDGDQ